MLRSFRHVVLLALITVSCGGASADPRGTTVAPASTVASSTRAPSTVTVGPSTTTTSQQPSGSGGVQACADVIGATVEPAGSGYRVSATVRSGDTGWEKYADAWIVRTMDGLLLGERVLTHPHETEQPFTRSLSDVAIPAGVSEVEIAARDSVNGYCGEVFMATVGS